jgi:hypothetical protein
MGYFLGIDVGAARTVAAVARSGNDGDAVDTVDLGDGDGRAGGVASVLHLGEDGTLAVGAAARARASTEPGRVVDGFPGRVGDGRPMLLAGEPWAPEELTAWLVRWVVDRVAEREGASAEAVAVTGPPSWDAERRRLLAAAVAEQDLRVRFPDPAWSGGPPEGGVDGTGSVRAQVRAASAAAVALRAAGGAGPADVTASGRHAATGGTSTALPAVRTVAEERRAPAADSAEAVPGGAVPGQTVPGDAVDEPAEDPGSGEGGAHADVGHDRDGSERDTGGRSRDVGGADGGGADGDDPASGGSRSVPVPRSHGSGGYHPATTNLLADLAGFTGGMGATNTAGLLSGYTPPRGAPTAWVGDRPAPRSTGTATATGGAVALPSQRSGSGRWDTVVPAPAQAPDDPGPARAVEPAALRARNNPAVLVGAGGLAAAVAVVGALLLWPAPRITNGATSRPVPAVPAATAPAAPAAAPTASPTPAVGPTPTYRARPASPRTRRPVAPPATATAPATGGTTAPPTGSSEPTESTTSAPPSTETGSSTSAPEED